MMGGMIMKLAQSAADRFLRHGEYLSIPPAVPTELMRQKAVFITIYENPGRHFRSAYGTPIPRQSSLAHEIVFNTIEAIRSSSTHNFRPIDLPYLAYDVVVVEALERVSRPDHLQPERFGLYLCSDRGKSAVILPQRVGIETADDQIATAFRESAIDPRAEAVTMYRFAVSFYEA